jgi:hypothetical protein
VSFLLDPGEKEIKDMNNFESRVKQPWTTYDNKLIQENEIFKNPYQKLGYIYLISYANASKIFPSMDAIAVAICGSKRTAMRTIQELESLKLIEVIRTKGLSNQYILNDYFEVILATSDRKSLVTESHGGSDRESRVPVTESHPKTKTIKIKTKNKISSSSDSKNSIDSKLKEKYPIVPFTEVKAQMLSDETLTIKTDKQYKSMLEYRLKNWKPAKAPRKQSKSIRKEIVPDHMDEPNYPTGESTEGSLPKGRALQEFMESRR